MISHLVYVAEGQDVVAVIADGKVMRDRKVFTVDPPRVKAAAAELPLCAHP